MIWFLPHCRYLPSEQALHRLPALVQRDGERCGHRRRRSSRVSALCARHEFCHPEEPQRLCKAGLAERVSVRRITQTRTRLLTCTNFKISVYEPQANPLWKCLCCEPQDWINPGWLTLGRLERPREREVLPNLLWMCRAVLSTSWHGLPFLKGRTALTASDLRSAIH